MRAVFFFSSRRRHTRLQGDWSSDVCSSDLSITAALPFLQDHRLRGLATTGAKRSDALPDLPTVIEAGLPGFEVDLWLGLFGPARLPPPALPRLNAETRKAIEHPDARPPLAQVGLEPRRTSAEEAAA